ncbi:MAG: helix-turn-helix domain-containing protein [Lachnospiraceae bacterium]|nr:helix-turn-helix domain-containing protein [Lachnospiraceae bacterium]
MNNMELLASALAYIENHLHEEIKTQDIADACFCSKSTLEKLFRCVNNISVKDYLIRRRMMKAARTILEEPQTSLLEIALRYGYSTNEAFTRTFKQVWNCKPSEFRHNTRFSELFPRLDTPLENGDAYMKERKHVDISELYDLFVTRKDCYFVCCDIKGLVPINNISRKAGDLAIMEAMNRMLAASSDTDVVFRIGGDEFALLTDSSDITYAESIAEKIKAFNGSPFCCENQDIPLSLHVSVTKYSGSHLKYNDLFTSLHLTIKNNKPSADLVG